MLGQGAGGRRPVTSRTKIARPPGVPEPVMRELAGAAWGYLVLGYVCAVTAIALLLSYVPR